MKSKIIMHRIDENKDHDMCGSMMFIRLYKKESGYLWSHAAYTLERNPSFAMAIQPRNYYHNIIQAMSDAQRQGWKVSI